MPRWLRAAQAIAIATTLLLPDVAAADPVPDRHSAGFFRAAAREDVEAAWQLLRDNHPGTVPELGDSAFRDTLQASITMARARVDQVSSLEGYLALMTGFDVGFGDRHVRTVLNFTIASPSWVGLIIGLRGTRWLVVDENPWPKRAALRGAALTGCDGRSADEVAQERLGGFRATWNIIAQRGLAAPWLLIDERNPFVKQLQHCSFDTVAGPVTIPMDWTPIGRDAVIDRIHRASGAGAAGFGLRRVGAGWWIAIQEFTENAPAVVAAARAQETELKAAPFVVVDVRGNGGGASAIGDDLAAVLFGKEAVAAIDESECLEAWRVSPGNLARLEAYPSLLGDRLTPEANARIQSDIQAMQAAAVAHRPFSRPITCAKHETPLRKAVGTPRIFLVTDRVCFSSCLIVVDHFRKLGAVQIGEPTNADTNYQENRRVTLPSGLAAFGVQTAVDPGEPSRFGPFVPSHAFEGDLTDTAAVEQWVTSSVPAWQASQTDR